MRRVDRRHTWIVCSCCSHRHTTCRPLQREGDLSRRSSHASLKSVALKCVVRCDLLAGCMSLIQPDPGWAQNQFGGQTRANAASRAIVLAVQQGISALPPTSGQSFIYEFDPNLGVPVRSERLGPISLRTPETIGSGKFTLRAATSYFALPASLGPIDYRLNGPFTPRVVYTKFGTEIDSKVGVLDLTVNYGITQRVEANLNLPIVVVDAQASQIFSGNPSNITALGFGTSIPKLNQRIEHHKVVLRTLSFSSLGFGFNHGTHGGIGRISLGTKALVYSEGPFQLATACDFYVPSPNEKQFAGSDSASILPRLIGTAKVTDWLRLRLDSGYDYDFGVSELRRFVWDAGISLPMRIATFDLGMGGSLYSTPIEWTPTHAKASFGPGEPQNIALTAIGDNQTGTNSVDFLAGAKVRVSDRVVLSGAVNVPVVETGLQPIVAGTVAVEVYF